MALPASGTISMLQVRTELAATGAISLGQATVRTLFGVPSGTISLSNGYGKSSGTPLIFAGYQTFSAQNTTSTGWGTKIANTTVNPTNMTYGHAWAGSSLYGCVEQGAGPKFWIWAWSGNWGTLYAQPATAAGVSTGGVSGFSITQGAVNVAAAGGYTAPYVAGYAFTQASGFGTKFASPSVSVGAASPSITFSNSGNTLFLGLTATPWLRALDVTNSGFGTLRTSAGMTRIVTYLRVPKITNTGLLVASGLLSDFGWYPYTDGSGFGTKVAGPTQTGYSISAVTVTPQVDAMLYAAANSPMVRAYRMTTTAFGTAYTSLSSLSYVSGPTALDIKRTNDQFIIGGTDNANNNAIMGPWSSTTGYGTLYASPNSNPSGVGARPDSALYPRA